jgi:5'-methylthioadenosine phosphorylase
VWKDHPVSAGEVGETMKANIEKVKRVLTMAISNIPKERECECKNALQSALV